MVKKQEYPVVIIGGGPVGLIASIALDRLGVEHLLVERHPSTSIHPKAVGFNQRTSEIFRDLGIDQQILDQAAPPDTVGRTSWYTSFDGATELHGKQIAIRDAWGGGEYAEEYRAASPAPYVVIPQIRLEPILRAEAERSNQATVLFGHEAVTIDSAETGARVVVRNRQDDSEFEVSAQYLIVADGGRTAAQQLGIAYEGPTNLVDMVSAHFRAPNLSAQVGDPGSLITWFVNPDFGGSIGSGYLYHIGPWDASGNSQEWVFACAFAADDPDRFDEPLMAHRIRRSLGLSDLEIEVESISHWYIQAVVAEKFRKNNAFLVGDAAHRIPPWGALGLNTGAQDVYNLVWKIAAALKSPQLEPLLDTYESERRPIALAVAESSLSNFQNHGGIVDAALGIAPHATPEENWAELAQLWQEGVDGKNKRAALAEAMSTLDHEFHAHGTECGFSYRSGALIPEEAPAADGIGRLLYEPSTVPGHHVPHVWVGGRSTLDIASWDRWVLLVDENAEIWKRALAVSAAPLAKYVEVAQFGAAQAEQSPLGSWETLRGVAADGAVLVRPDRIVAWRGQDSLAAAQLDTVLSQLVRAEKPAKAGVPS